MKTPGPRSRSTGSSTTRPGRRRSTCACGADVSRSRNGPACCAASGTSPSRSGFDTSLKGPVNALETDLRLAGTGGGVHGHLTLDTSVPGWHGTGAVDVERLNLARWLNRPDRPSDITGPRDLQSRARARTPFPARHRTPSTARTRCTWDYAADGVSARGQITSTAVLIAEADATAYGAQGDDEGRVDRHRRAVPLPLSRARPRASTCGGCRRRSRFHASRAC